jgi:integrase
MHSTQLHSPRLTPWVALVLFGGLRPDEARRIAWEDIRDGFVHVEGVKAKTRRRRLIPISPQLAAWLDAARAVEAPLPPIGWDRDWRRARDKAGLKDRYSHNALRHFFASNISPCTGGPARPPPSWGIPKPCSSDTTGSA